MTIMNFPSSPNIGDEYIFSNTTYIWDGAKWVAQKPNEQNMNQLLEAHKNGLDQHPIGGIHGLADALLNAGDAVLDVKWLPKRSPMRTGYAAGDGQALSRSLYPDAFAAIQAGLVPVCTDAEWVADPGKRGCFTLGDGATTFRVPDYNGMQPGSYGPVYLGGGSAASGAILRDRIQNIVGTSSAVGADRFGTSPGSMGDSGAFLSNPINSTSTSLVGASANRLNTLITGTFDASRVARTGDTTRPITAEGCLAIKLFGAVQNAGSADAAALATAVATLAARVTALEGRTFTTLIPATYPSGAPHDTHETVVSELPANITYNSIYTLPNPFGINTRADVVIEVWVNGRWAEPGWDGNSGTGGVSFGADASYVQGVGIVVQTGVQGVVGASNQLGGGVASNTWGVVSAPCRVAIRKWEVW